MPPEKWAETCNIAWIDFSALHPQIHEHLLHVGVAHQSRLKLIAQRYRNSNRISHFGSVI